MPYLAFNLNDGNEFIFDLLEDRLSLGRNPRNEIVIDNSQISSFHAEFARQPNGSYLLTDLKSSNGTFVNGRRVESAALKPGDRVRFGQLEARFREMFLPGPGREKKGPAPSAAEKRRDAESTEEPRPQTDYIPVEKAPADAVAPLNARNASAPVVQPLAPTSPSPGSSTTIPKPTPAPVQIVARAPVPAPSAVKLAIPPPQPTPQKPPDSPAPQPARTPSPVPAITAPARESQEKLTVLKAEISEAQAKLDKLRDDHARELEAGSVGHAAMEKERGALAADLVAARQEVETLGRERDVRAKELESLAVQCSAREEEHTGLLARMEKLAATDSRLASAGEALKLVAQQKSAAEAALDDLRTVHEQERKNLDETKAGHAEARKLHAEAQEQISQLRSEHDRLEKSAAEALKLVAQQKSAAEVALDDLRTAHEQERKNLDETKAGHAEARKLHAESQEQISQLRCEHDRLEKSAAEALKLVAQQKSAAEAALDDLRTAHEQERKNLDETKAGHAEARKLHAEAQEQISQLRCEHDRLEKSAAETLKLVAQQKSAAEAALDDLRRAHEQERKNLDETKAGHAEARKLHTEAQERISQLRSEHDLIEKDTAQARAAAEARAAEEASRKERLATLEKELAENTVKLEEERAELAEAGERLSDVEKKSRRLEQEASVAQESLDAVKKQRHEGLLAVEELAARKEALRQQLVRLERETADAQERESSASSAVKQHKEELTALLERAEAARESLAQLEDSHEEATYELRAAKEKHLAELEELKSRLATVAKLLEETSARHREAESHATAAEGEARKHQEKLDALLSIVGEKASLVASLDERHRMLSEAAAGFAGEEASRRERLATQEKQLEENTKSLETKRAQLAEAGDQLSTLEKRSLELEGLVLKAQASLESLEKQRREELVAVEDLTARRETLRQELVRLERERADGEERNSAAAAVAGQRQEELAALEERAAAARESLAQVEASHSEAAHALQAAQDQAEPLRALNTKLNAEISAAKTALHDLVARRTSEEDRTATLAGIAGSRQQDIEEAGRQLDGLRQERAQAEEALRQLRDGIDQEDRRLASAQSGVEAAEKRLADLKDSIGESESMLAGKVAQLTKQVEDLRQEEDSLATRLQANRESLGREEASLEDLRKKLAADETRHAGLLRSGDKLLSLDEAVSVMEAREQSARHLLGEAAEQELALQVKLNALIESVAREQRKLDQVLRERAHEDEDRTRALEKAGRDLEEAGHRASEEAKRSEIALTTRIRERVRELEAKHEALRQSLQASTDEKTVILFANDIIKRMDLIDILIQRVTGPGINGGMEQQLRTLRASFEDILEGHGIAEFKVAPGTEVDIRLRQQIAIVESVPGLARAKVVESYRPGFIYSCEPGREVVLRKVEVKTSSE